MQRVPRDRALLHRLYVEEEESTLTLSRRFGVAPISVNRALRDMGISIRTKRSAGDKRRVALGKQANTKLSVHESALLLALHGRGLQPVPHLAVERFNVDLGFPDARLAVEIDGGNWHASPRKQAQDEAKESYLLAHGWRVIRFATTRSGWTDHAAQTVAAALAASTIGS